MHTSEFRAMGSRIFVAIDADLDQAADLSANVPLWFEDWEQCLSRFRKDSELSRLNRRDCKQSGNSYPLSPTLFEVMDIALQAARYTDGLLDPTLLDSIEAAGYDRTFEAVAGSERNERSLENKTLPRTGRWSELQLCARSQSVTLPKQVRLDFGGIAKGWAAHRAAHRLAQHGAALVDAGGDIVMSGPRNGTEQWPIAVADPFSPGDQLALLKIDNGSVATSGQDYRRWQQDGQDRHHIIDPRTGKPAATDVFTATVIAPQIWQAEAAAKATLILGSKEGLKWIEDRQELAALIVLNDATTICSSRLVNYLWREP